MRSGQVSVSESLQSLEAVAARDNRHPIPNKFAYKRTELAKAALETLAELGFANTSLRDIAQNTKYSHGVLHYYFKDKVDLITCSVHDYKAICATRYDVLVDTAKTEAEFLEGFGEIAADSLLKEAPLHRLWYDLRVQSMFSDAYRGNIMEIDATLERMTWRIFEKFCSFADITPQQSSTRVYGLFDGMFQTALLHYLNGTTPEGFDLKSAMRELLIDIRALDGAS